MEGGISGGEVGWLRRYLVRGCFGVGAAGRLGIGDLLAVDVAEAEGEGAGYHGGGRVRDSGRRCGGEEGGEIADELFFYETELPEFVAGRLAWRRASMRLALGRAIEAAADLRLLCRT